MTVSTQNELHHIPLTDIHADDEFNCRGQIAPIDVAELAKDIEQNGLLQPVIICEYASEKQKETGYKYLLIAGYRRYKAHRALGRDVIPCLIKENTDELTARIINLSENFQRKNLNLLQEAQAVKKLKDLGLNEIEVSKRLGMSRGWVQVRFIVLELPKHIQDECAAGMYSQLHIRDIYSHYLDRGEEGAYEVAKTIKARKARGETHVRAQKKAKPSTKRRRNNQEMYEMMNHMQETIGNGLHTRALAWAAGEINSLELYESIRIWDDRYGKGDYVVPNYDG